MFEVCPVCKGTYRVMLVEDWQARVHAKEPVPIVGCGNPWHYLVTVTEVVEETVLVEVATDVVVQFEEL